MEGIPTLPLLILAIRPSVTGLYRILPDVHIVKTSVTANGDMPMPLITTVGMNDVAPLSALLAPVLRQLSLAVALVTPYKLTTDFTEVRAAPRDSVKVNVGALGPIALPATVPAMPYALALLAQ